MSRAPAATLAKLRRASRARRRAEAGYRALILEAAGLGLSQSAIAQAAECSRQNVQQILRRPTTVEGRARPGARAGPSSPSP
jgi:DNA-directed RNA polymerase specialized sigma24 family protein